MKTYNLYILTLFLTVLLSCNQTDIDKEPPTHVEVNLSKNLSPDIAEEDLPDSGVIEAISPLKLMGEAQAQSAFPQRGETKSKASEFNRLADIMKSRATDPKFFEEIVPFDLVMDNLELGTAVKVFSETLEFEYILDPGVKGFVKADISLADSLTLYDAWKLFEQVLYINNAYASVSESGIVSVFPLSKIAQDSVIQSVDKSTGNVSLGFFPLKNINASDAVAQLKPFMGPNASLSVLAASNALLMVETSANLEKLKAIVEALDNHGKADWPQMTYKCQYVNAVKLLEELQSALPVLGFSINTGDATGQGVRMVALERLDVLVVSAPSQLVVHEIYKWIQILDTFESEGEEKVFYYPVKHGVSDDLVAALQLFFPNTANASTPGTTASTNSSSSRTGAAASTSNSTGTNRTRTSTSNTAKTNEPAASIFDEGVTIFEDMRRNQLVIRTKAKTFAMVKAILRHLDAPSMQVLIEVTAVEVELGEGLEFGFEYAATDKFGSGDNLSGIGVGSTNTDTPSFGPPGDLNPGISLLLQSAGVDSEFAFVQAVAGDSKTQLLFTPHILTLNGEPAEINIGQSVPIRVGSVSTSSNNDYEQIEYRNTGVIVRVTPQVSADKYVTLDTEIELSSIVEQDPDDVLIDSPTFNENTVKTKLLMKNKETILLGGIIQKGASQSTSGVPFLKDIPWIGFLFSSAKLGEKEKELVIFIKATVIEQESDFEGVLERYNDVMEYRDQSPEIK
ncbi:secretin N-terminal domain-containing protein [Lentisphaera profundi]|uniref:Secretin N-terminal domain-containing protein n=1 Tax=Lentisphaera profundi TaxID=1658616 RepID=A0ABY7VTY5_9BACT|nr:secretin N-terminal domain-containing protein [Lentisphaera profundi]WDE97671.1 secretin N-terminal domain-containing protein [Lentisphaera profundi]